MAKTPASDPHRVPWHHRPFWVLLLLFFVLGPLGLPYLWKSPRFSDGLKVVLTLAVLVYTGLLVQETIAMVHVVREQVGALR